MKKIIFLFLLSFALNVEMKSQEESRLMRFPAVFQNTVVFSYAGDLYSVPLTGGIARQLTNDKNGFEVFPRFSPDGKNIAFTGQYDGNTEVYLIPALGGEPKRLTITATIGRDDLSDRMGPNNVVMTWRDNESIVFRSRKQTFNDFKGQLFVANINGGIAEELPLPDGSWCSFGADGNKMAYNRVFREFRTWKYYKGGMADDIWMHDFTTHETKNLTNNESQDIFPMWKGDFVYFLSDRDRTMNLFSYNLKDGTTKKLTNYTEYDIKFPSLGTNSIVYENGGYLYNFDLGNQSATKIPVQIISDLTLARTKYIDASKSINTYDISPDGQRVIFGARGDVYSVPAKTGITRNLTASNGAHDRDVAWSPDGKFIAFISDQSGEDEIFIQDQLGEKPALQITSGSTTYKFSPGWSPDSKKIMWSDKEGKLNMVDIDTKIVTTVAESNDFEINTYTWSNDSKWIAYTMPSTFSVSRIFVYSIDTKEANPVTDTWYDASSPSFDPSGKYLYFTSSRDFNATYSWTEWNHVYTDMSRIYLVTLQKETVSPFVPENNEVALNKEAKVESKDEKDSKKDKKESAAPAMKIDFDGIMNRIIQLPVAAGAYWNINPVEGGVYYAGNSKDERKGMFYYDLKTKKETELGNYQSFVLSADKKKMVIATGGNYTVIDAPKSIVKAEEFVDLSNMKLWVNLNEEWNQIFTESWRQMRDFFYAPNMHGVDWKSIHAKYQALVPFVAHRNDLNYLIGEMIGELSIGHAYVNGGDKPSPERIQTGLLGAKISRDASGFYKIDEILNGESWVKTSRSPLRDMGVSAKEGDFIVAIDGVPTTQYNDIYIALIGKANKQVEISFNSKPELAGARKSIVIPTGDEAGLYYYSWVQSNIEKVNKATNGQVGYIHIPDMGPEGLNEFVKYYYPQLNKKALIIDDRGNGGGNVSPMIIERLNRELALYGMSRNNGVNTKPAGMMLGPKVLLLDKYSASDGDLFPYQFKKLKIGKTIGMRSWGGVVGIRGSLPFIDGGDLRRPEFAPFDENGKWVIEGHGVDPDIIIDNDPYKEYLGDDQQLNKAVEVILEEMKNYPELPQVPQFPDKSK
ncbi:MAG: protease [Bacteroidales bacterium]|nr:protease [Bacteroidales bacterium]